MMPVQNRDLSCVLRCTSYAFLPVQAHSLSCVLVCVVQETVCVEEKTG